MAGLQSQGIIPGVDFSVIGFDDIDVASTWQPPLASVAVVPERIGTAAARMLLERMANANLPPLERRLHPQLVLRQSCGSKQKFGYQAP